MEYNRMVQGNVLDVLRSWPDDFIDCIVSSPPYWGLRSYGDQTKTMWGGDVKCHHQYKRITRKPTGGRGSKTANVGANKNDLANMRGYEINTELCVKCGMWFGQLGLEPTLDLYLTHMAQITCELKRVLKKSGTMFWNHGDSYGTGSREGSKSGTVRGLITSGREAIPGYEKSLIMQNYRLVLKMVDEQSWILRNTCIWKKPNAMPSSVKDRFSNDYEPVFFFSKSKKYWFNQQFEPYAPSSDVRYRVALRNGKDYKTKPPYLKNTPYMKQNKKCSEATVQSRDGFPGDHLVVGGSNTLGRAMRTVWDIPTQPLHEAHFAAFPLALVERCIRSGCPVGGLVLDPFMGSGTVAIVARKLNMGYLGIEINPDYIAIAQKRLEREVGTLL